MYNNRRTRTKDAPLPNLPPGASAQQPAVIAASRVSNHVTFPTDSSYSFEVTPPVYEGEHFQNPWDFEIPPQPPPRPRVQSMNASYSPRMGHTPYDTGARGRMAFPEPNVHGFVLSSQTLSTPQRLSHHHSRSDFRSNPTSNNQRPHNASVSSFASSYNAHDDDRQYGSEYDEGYENATGALAKGLADLSLTSEDALRRFQDGKLAENDQEWHRLVPVEAQEALGKREVQRQSVIFEVIKSEREYVADLEAVQDVFIKGLRSANPPIFREPHLSAFINELFGNLGQILAYHQRLLAALFARQREQHPLIQSVADIILDTTLGSDFRDTYEVYIKRYPLAESHHRKQLKLNRPYELFIHSASNDPRIRKRDLITFLSRPVTKLPRLNLLLEQILKLTEPEYSHPDLETLPIILNILKDCIKSTQPGIEAAESKVKFWALCESLVFQKGEIIDMNLYDESRSLVYTSSVFRRVRTDTGFSEKWSDLVAALLDNYFILTREEKRPNGSIKRILMSRPMPLSFLRLGSFNSPPETRREKADDGGLLESWRTQSVPIYPFTIYHGGNKSSRRYTLYVSSDAQRKKWYNAFVDAMGVHKVREEANMWFSPQNITDGFFRSPPRDPSHQSAAVITSKIRCAAPYTFGSPSRRYLVVGCGSGVYVGLANSEKFRQVLSHKNTTAMAALTTCEDNIFNRLILHVDSSLLSYSLDILTRLYMGKSDKQALDASMERVGGSDMNATLFKHVHIAGRALLICSSKRRLGTSLNLQVFEAISSVEQARVPKRSNTNSMRGFRPFGEPGYIPKDASNIIGLAKTIGICTTTGIITLDPTNLVQSGVTVVPEFRDSSNNEAMASLKARTEGRKPLGFVRANPTELLVIYDEIGFYIDKHGVPARRCGYIKWEVKATAYAQRNGHILLISPEFIEVRNVITSRLVQVIEGQDIRLLYSGPYASKQYPVLVAMQGGKDDKDGVSDKIVELTETEEISAITPSTATSSIWDEWDM